MAGKEDIQNKILNFQRNQITEHYTYKKLAETVRDEKNSLVLNKISAKELYHYNILKKITLKDVEPSRLQTFFFYIIARIFGLNFSLRLMERIEKFTEKDYDELKNISPALNRIIMNEERLEHEALNLISEEHLSYTSSIILGLNDALVELTGALAGFTLALQQTRLIAVVGLITGIAASLSMTGTAYLSAKDDKKKNLKKATIYTGGAYLLTVLLLLSPYFVFKNPLFCLGISVSLAILIIFIFNFYVAIAKELPFRKRFFEMLCISFGVAIINFILGMLIRVYYKI